ncbi:MAG TPA: tetratricopeptide repeat-containing diguanylate cyclase, partial [Arenimonas sp.]|nr:tetratricopeptide repeat-containing diguanylate cyclase [Arenimonas sp.]
MLPADGPALVPVPRRLAWPGAALLLAFALPAFAQPVPAEPGLPDPAAATTLQAWQANASHWLSTLATAAVGEEGRVRLAVAQARFASAARAPDTSLWLRRTADIAGQAAFRRERVEALSALSNEAYRRGDIAAVIAVENEAMADALRLGDRREQAGSYFGLGMAAQAQGRLDDAERDFERAIAIWKALDEDRLVAVAQRALGRAHETRGRYAQAVEMQVDALEQLLVDGRAIDQSESYYALARLFYNLEDYEAALKASDQAISLMGERPPDFPLGLNLVLRSQLHVELGQAEPALADARAAVAAFERNGGDLGLALGSLALGRALVIAGEPADGVASLREGMLRADAINERVLGTDLRLALGRALVAMGRPAEALEPLAVAQAVGEELKLDRLLQDVSLEQERAWTALGRSDEALAASKRAFEQRKRMTSFGQLGQLAADSGSRRARERFMALEAGEVAGAAVPRPVSDAASGLPRWTWALAIPMLLLAWGLLRLGRHVRHLRREKHQMSARQRALEDEHLALRARVSVDPLTGAMTRPAFAAELATLLSHAENHGRSVALLVFDLDNFKAVNDSLGHLAGDEALRLASGIARGKLRSVDLLGRFGGDEFLVACEGLDQQAAE